MWLNQWEYCFFLENMFLIAVPVFNVPRTDRQQITHKNKYLNKQITVKYIKEREEGNSIRIIWQRREKYLKTQTRE